MGVVTAGPLRPVITSGAGSGSKGATGPPGPRGLIGPGSDITGAQIEDRINEGIDLVGANVPLADEIADSVIWPSGSLSATTTQALFVAPYPCRLEQLSMAFSGAIPHSTTDFWTLTLKRYRAGSAVSIGAKTTKVATNGEPILAYVEWHYDNVAFVNANFVKGDVLAVTMTKTGSPAALTPQAATFRMPAYDSTLVPVEWEVLLIEDGFTRANSTTSLGNADTGQTWVQPIDNVSTYGILSNQMYGVAAGQKRATIDVGTADVAVEVTLVDIGVSGSSGVILRSSSASNFIGTSNLSLYKTVGGIVTQLVPIDPPLADGDRVRVEAVGNDLTLLIDRNNTGDWSVVGNVSESFNNDQTVVGIRSSGGNHKLDNFRAWAP